MGVDIRARTKSASRAKTRTIADSAKSGPEFQDIAPKAGLTVPHISLPDKKYILESMSGGVGLIDCDNDGKLDVVTVNGSTVGALSPRRRPDDHSLSSGYGSQDMVT
jgi:hypothetical protein